jgi:hypothetical protein
MGEAMQIPRGFDVTITQPSPLTFLRVQCRTCAGFASRNPECDVCGGVRFRAIPFPDSEVQK